MIHCEIRFVGGPWGGQVQALPLPVPRIIRVAVQESGKVSWFAEWREEEYELRDYNTAYWLDPTEKLRQRIKALESQIEDLTSTYVQVSFLESPSYSKLYTYKDPWGNLAVGELVEVEVSGVRKPVVVKKLGKGFPGTITKSVVARYTKKEA